MENVDERPDMPPPAQLLASDLGHLRNAPMPLAVLSLRDREFFIDFASDAFCALRDRPEEMLEGRAAFEVMPELKAQGVEALLLEVLQTKSPRVGREVPLRLVRGGQLCTCYFTFTYAPLDDHEGRPRVFICGIEVTDQVHAVQHLELAQSVLVEAHLDALRNENRFKSLVSASAAIVLTIDPRDGRVRLLEGWQEFCGVTQTEGTWSELREYFHPDDWEVIRNAWRSAVAEGDRAQFECRLRRKDGSWARVIVRAAAIRLLTGEIEEWVAAIEDVSARFDLQEKMKESERLTSLGTLVAGVAHEINNPISYIISNLRYVLEDWGPQSDADLRDALQDALDGATRAAQIVQDLRLMSRQGSQDVFASDVVQALEAALRVAQGEIRQRAVLVREIAPLPEVDSDPVHLTQVFVNLLMNAAQAIPEGHPERNRVTVTTFIDGAGRACTRISDTGGGIPEAVRARVFEPFFTTKPPGKGTGLGLSICHGIVKKLGGEILVHSTPGEGTTFTVCLPPGELGT